MPPKAHTFYRHFSSKDELILAFLDDRHQRWMAWFEEALARHTAAGKLSWSEALLASMAQWFEVEDFRGCAFINAAAETGTAQPLVIEAVRGHKAAMTAAIARLLPESAHQRQIAQAASVALDGAIVQANLTAQPVQSRVLGNCWGRLKPVLCSRLPSFSKVCYFLYSKLYPLDVRKRPKTPKKSVLSHHCVYLTRLCPSCNL